jgi:hypothetical protein
MCNTYRPTYDIVQPHFMGLIPNQEYQFLLLENKIVNLYNLAKAHFIGKYSCYTTNPASADYKNLKLELENDSYN